MRANLRESAEHLPFPSPRIRHRVIDLCCPAALLLPSRQSTFGLIMCRTVVTPKPIVHMSLDRREQALSWLNSFVLHVYALVSPSDSTYHSSKWKYVFTLQHPTTSLT